MSQPEPKSGVPSTTPSSWRISAAWVSACCCAVRNFVAAEPAPPPDATAATSTTASTTASAPATTDHVGNGRRDGRAPGSGNIDAKDQLNFAILPPGRYILTGRPNPGSDSEETEPVTLDVKGGQAAEVTLKAK